MHNKKSVAVDLDGVLAEYDIFKGIDIIGDPIPGAKEFVKKLKKKAKIIIHTCRVSGVVKGDENFANRLTVDQRVIIVKEWLEKHDIPFDEIWTGRGKPYAVAYIDDRAVVVNRPHEVKCKEYYGWAWIECVKLLEGKRTNENKNK